jgi:hypothetical protein
VPMAVHQRDMTALEAAAASLALAERTPLLERLRADPSLILSEAELPPDRWQREILRFPSRRTMLLCARQAGKSLTAAALALRTALLEPCKLVLLLSPTQRQSGELFRDKVLRLYNALGRPVPAANPRDNALRLELANGSRIVSLPGTEATVRGYSGVNLLVIDEAARVSDSLYRSARPMLAVSHGSLIALSTPFGKRGWFYEEWVGSAPWKKVKITASQCPRIDRQFLEEEKRALGPRWYSQEYDPVSFEEVVDAFFSAEDVQAAFADDLTPLFVEGIA